jgi:sugar/nucleoside kinase (ribokinase family)
VIACLGDLILDVLVRRVGVKGHESAVEQVAVVPGGAAANTAAWLADLGAEVGFLGAAGDDFSGDMLVHDLELRGVRCLVKRSESRPTGILLLETAPNRPPRVAARRGANDDYELDDTQRAFIATVTWLHVTAYAFFSETARAHQHHSILALRTWSVTSVRRRIWTSYGPQSQDFCLLTKSRQTYSRDLFRARSRRWPIWRRLPS